MAQPRKNRNPAAKMSQSRLEIFMDSWALFHRLGKPGGSVERTSTEESGHPLLESAHTVDADPIAADLALQCHALGPGRDRPRLMQFRHAADGGNEDRLVIAEDLVLLLEHRHVGRAVVVIHRRRVFEKF